MKSSLLEVGLKVFFNILGDNFNWRVFGRVGDHNLMAESASIKILLLLLCFIWTRFIYIQGKNGQTRSRMFKTKWRKLMPLPMLCRNWIPSRVSTWKIRCDSIVTAEIIWIQPCLIDWFCLFLCMSLCNQCLIYRGEVERSTVKQSELKQSMKWIEVWTEIKSSVKWNKVEWNEVKRGVAWSEVKCGVEWN